MRWDGSTQRAASGTSSSCSRSAPSAVEREPAEQDHARDRVGGLREAGAREVVVDEALRAEAGEQALGDALLEVQVDGVLGEHARVLEDDRPDRRLAAPVGELLVLLAGRAQRVEGGGPARVGLGAAVERREGPDRAAVLVRSSRRAARRRAARGSRRGRRGRAPARSPTQLAGRLEQGLAALDLRLQVVLALAGGLELLLGDALLLRVEVRLLDLAREPLGVAVADALAEPALDVVVDDLGEAAELLLDRLGLPDEHLEHAVLGALRQHEVVAADLGGRLELAVDAAVALLDAAGVPGQVEVEEVGAVGLEVQALAGGVGGEQDAQRVLGRVGVEAALDLLAPGAAREAVDHLDALVGAVGALDGLLEDRP